MLTDLGKDWSSGPPSDYNRFVPMLYVIQLQLDDYDINMYANDHNIVDRPLSMEENGQSCSHIVLLSSAVSDNARSTTYVARQAAG